MGATLALAGLCSVPYITPLRGRRAFEAVCASVHAGDSAVAVERSFLAMGAGSGRGGTVGGPHTTHYWYQRSGLARYQQCEVTADRADVVLSPARYRAATDFSSCTDPRAYPHRHWLCSVADAVVP